VEVVRRRGLKGETPPTWQAIVVRSRGGADD